jgi:hypothetical protein
MENKCCLGMGYATHLSIQQCIEERKKIQMRFY